MGLQDVFFKLRLPFDSEAARALSRADLRRSLLPCAAHVDGAGARARGASELSRRPAPREVNCSSRPGTCCRPHADRWRDLSRRYRAHGLRNSLLIAIAPTATIASIAGCYECIEPQISNLFKRETLSGDFLQVNRYLVEELKALGLWTPEMRDAIKLADGSIQRTRRACRRNCGTSTALPGNCRCGADRYGRGSRRLHRSEPIA